MAQTVASEPDPSFLTTAMADFRSDALKSVAVTLIPLGIAVVASAQAVHSPLEASRVGTLLILLALVVLIVGECSYLVGAWLLVLGGLGANLLVLHLETLDSLASLLALSAGLATFLVGSRAGAFTAGLVTVGLVVGPRALFPAVDNQTAVVAAIWGTVGLIWVTRRPTLHAIQWAWSGYDRANQLLEEAREQRVQLLETQEDLVQANRELARLSDRLKVMHQVAEDARRVKAEFVANVSHELRTPLNMIIGFSEMIAQAPEVYGELPPMLLADITAIQRNAQHLKNLVDDVLDVSQIEANRMALIKEPASLGEIVEAAAEAVRSFFESKGLYLEVEVPPDLPPLVCDPTRIRQVILNLLSNAGRFTEQGRTRIRVRQESQWVVVSVSDTGPGISPEQQARLFEPFRQLDGSPQQRRGGSGLGLSIGKRFVEMHGGEMWLESQVGKGSTFYFSLPLGEPATGEPAGADFVRWFSPYQQYELRTRRSRAPVAGLTPRFVILEQGHALRRLLVRYMGGAEFVSVADAPNAACELSRAPAQALIVNSPTLRHGVPAVESLPEAPYGTPIVVCWVPGEEGAAEELGVVSYLVKPVDREALLAGVEALGEGVRTVLLVDDDPEVLQLFTRMLSSAGRGYRVLRATNGQEALSLLRERRPDAMLLDLMLPGGMDGFQVLQEKSRDDDLRAIPTIVVSAHEAAGHSIVSNTLIASRGDLSAGELIAYIRAVTEALSPSDRSPAREPTGTPGA